MNDKKTDYSNLVFVDLETSGFDFKKNEIIQIGAIDATTGDTFECKVDFNIDKADSKALEVNGFDENVWDETGIPLGTALHDLSRFFKHHSHLKRIGKSGAPYKLCAMAGYNILGFDNLFLRRAFEKIDLFMPADYRVFDVYALALWVCPGLQGYKLEDMCNMFEVSIDKAHDALSDARATMELCKKILRHGNFDLPVWAKDEVKQ